MIDALLSKFVMGIPYRSQWDEDGNDRQSDCGPTCNAMLAQWLGIYVPIDSLTAHESTESGMTTATHLVQNFADLGIEARTVMLDENAPTPRGAICLVEYAGFDRDHVQDVNYTGWHWLILLKEMPNYVIVHDPDWWPSRRDEGAHHVFTRAEWDAAFKPYDGDTQRTCVVLV